MTMAYKVDIEDVKAMLSHYMRQLERDIARHDDPTSNDYHHSVGLYNGYKDAYEMLTGDLPILKPKK